jgi:hypothetical protein
MPRIPLVLLALAACAAPAPPPPAPPPAAEPAPAADPGPPLVAVGSSVWNRDPGAELRGETEMAVLPYLFLRLEVLEADSTELRVRCVHCPGAPEGWIARERVVHHPAEPRHAALLDLADFVLAVRDAALRRDLDALRPVMARDFSHQLGPVEPGLLETLAAWEREGYRTLDRLPFLLDRGVAALPRSPVWAAPPEHTTTLLYRDLRAGFRRGPDGWEWVFLVRDGL